MSNPLYIADCIRKNGVTFLTVQGSDLTAADEGQMVKVMGVSDRTVNGEFTISKIVPPSTIQFLQPNETDIPAGITGGAVSTEPRPVAVVVPKAAAAPAKAEATKPDETLKAEAAKAAAAKTPELPKAKAPEPQKHDTHQKAHVAGKH